MLPAVSKIGEAREGKAEQGSVGREQTKEQQIEFIIIIIIIYRVRLSERELPVSVRGLSILEPIEWAESERESSRTVKPDGQTDSGGRRVVGR